MGAAGSSSGKAAPTVLRGFRSEFWAEKRTAKKEQEKTQALKDPEQSIEILEVETNEKMPFKEEVKERITEKSVSMESENPVGDKPESCLKKTIKTGSSRTLYAVGKSNEGFRSYAKFSFNVNARHGGCTSLLFVACATCDYNTELFLVRSGFDCNHFETKSISHVTEKPEVYYEETATTHAICDVSGTFIVDQYCAHNDNMMLTNDSRNDDLQIGVFLESGHDGSEVKLPIDLTRETHGIESSLGILLCSGISDGTPVHSIYLILTRTNTIHTKCISGNEESYTFERTEENDVIVHGIPGSHFALFNNRDILKSCPGRALVSKRMSTDGTEKVLLLENVQIHATLLVLCSNSNGTENSTASSVYQLSIFGGKLVEVKEISGCCGLTYNKSDLWTFDVLSSQLWVTCPSGPCRFAILSNILASDDDILTSNHQNGCLATGEPYTTTGNIECTLSKIDGTINKTSEILIMVDHKIIRTIPANELIKNGDVFKFSSQISEETKEYGKYLVRVFAIRKHEKTGKDQFIELTGSPKFLVNQKPGVIYALNCFGPVYHSLEDIVYLDDLELNGNFDPNLHGGNRYNCIGYGCGMAHLHASMQRTDDGFLFATTRKAESFNEFRHSFIYTVKDLPNGTFKLRLYLTDKVKHLLINSVPVSSAIDQQLDELRKPSDLHGKASYCVELDVVIQDNTMVLQSKFANTEVWQHTDKICAFALLEKSFKDKKKTDKQIKEEEAEKHKLADKAIPLDTTATRKTITIIGWSQNLLKNASGENGDMKYWNTSGDVTVLRGEKTGYGTEACFSTSYMWSSKNQEINLLDYFTAEYLDTAPDIQVSEMYKMNHCGGGFYIFEAQLLSEDGKVIKEYSTGQLGTLTNSDWKEASVTFSDYGTGVRIVSFTSQGKDDKYWAGYFGPFISAASVRVRRESNPAKGDTFADIEKKEESSQRSDLDKLVTKVLSDNAILLKDFIEDDSMPVDKDFERQTADLIDTFKTKDTKKKTHKKREIRVFVSSTFRDFTMEREEIIKKAFREINRICVDRGVFFTYVDLRWGITTEQTDGGKTISICLQEIDRCRPYFICLMGDRFGWAQKKEKKDDLLDMSFDYAIENNPDFKWVDDYRYDASVTQLEILHGVLNNPKAVKDTCFFYMRDPPKEHEVPPELYKRMVSESEWHRKRQDALKAMVQKHPEIKVAKFKTAVEVSDLIKKDLEHCVDVAFPKGTELTKLELQREAHEAFASVRCQVYIGRQEYFTEINKHREEGINQPFVLLGESGCGKSALVANWVKQIENAEPETFVFVHFIGSSADSAHYIKMIRRLFEEMKNFFHFDLQIPSSDSVLIHDLGRWLRMAGSITKVLVVFDAVNQLDDGSGVSESSEHDLQWIPPDVPHNVFILVSTLPGRAMDTCKEAGWPSMKVEPLQESQKMEIITDYLEGIYRKTLTKEQKQMIVNEKQTSNPLYLKSLLDEVRMYGSFRTLTNKISEYLSADTPQELFGKILERLEDDFDDSARKRLVQDTTTALWCSNKGMSESELKELLGVNSAVWSPFYISLFENLVNRNGILNFFHDHLRQAVERKYLSTPETKRKGYLRLADFHSTKETSTRTVEELPFLFTRARELERLKETVTDLKVFYKLSSDEDGIYELVKAWKTLGGFALSEEAYMSKIEEIPKKDIESNPTYFCELYSRLGNFFLRIGVVNAARKVYETLIKQLESNYGEEFGTVVYNPHDRSFKYRCKHPEVIKGLHELGTVYSKLGHYKKARDVYEDAISRQNRIVTPSQKLQLCEGMLGLAAVRIQLAEMMEAKVMMTKALELATFVLGKKHHYVAAIFSRLGQLAYKQGRVDEALAYYLQDLKVTRSEVGTNHPRTAIVLNEIALVYDDKNDISAGKLYEAALTIILDTYGNDYLGTGNIRFNLGAFYFGTNYFSKALYQFTESYKIHQLFLGDDHPDTLAVKEALKSVTAMVSTDDVNT